MKELLTGLEQCGTLKGSKTFVNKSKKMYNPDTT